MFGFIVLGAVATLGSATVAFVIGRRRTANRRLPLTPIARVDGASPVRVHGRVQPRDTLRAPLTGRPCVYFQLAVRIDMVDVIESGHITRARDFAVHDDTGIAHVVTERATFDVVSDIVEMDRARFISPAAVATLRSFGITLPEVGAVELREGIIAPGDEVDLVGQPVCEPSSDAGATDRGYRDAPPFIAVFSVVQVLGEQREGRYIGKPAR